MNDKARAIPPPVWLIALVHLGLGIAYSVLLPTWRGPDEPHHVDLVLRMADGQTYPSWDEARISRAVTETLDRVGYFEGSNHLERSAAPGRSSRQPFRAELLLEDSGAPNQIAQHPPGYYIPMGVALTAARAVAPGDASFDLTVGGLRILNALLLSCLAPVTYLIAKRLGASRAAATAGSLIPLTVPQYLAIGASVNNDNLLVLLVSMVALVVVRIGAGDMRRGTAFVGGALAGSCLWVKAFGIVAPLWLGLAYLVALVAAIRLSLTGDRALAGRAPDEEQSSNASPRRVLAAGSIAGATAFLVGAWWWLHNLSEEGELQPGIELLAPAPDGFEPDAWRWTKRYFPWMARRFWGWFGWFDVKIPGPVAFIASVVLLVLIVVGISSSRRRWSALVLAAGIPVLLLAGAQLAWSGYTYSGASPAIQGRYLFAALPAVAAIGGVGLGRVFRRSEMMAPIVVWIFGTAMHCAALAVVVPWYWGSDDATPLERIEALGAWSPWPGYATVTMLAVPLLLWLILGYALVSDMRTEPTGRLRSSVRSTELDRAH